MFLSTMTLNLWIHLLSFSIVLLCLLLWVLKYWVLPSDNGVPWDFIPLIQHIFNIHDTLGTGNTAVSKTNKVTVLYEGHILINKCANNILKSLPILPEGTVYSWSDSLYFCEMVLMFMSPSLIPPSNSEIQSYQPTRGDTEHHDWGCGSWSCSVCIHILVPSFTKHLVLTALGHSCTMC